MSQESAAMQPIVSDENVYLHTYEALGAGSGPKPRRPNGRVLAICLAALCVLLGGILTARRPASPTPQPFTFTKSPISESPPVVLLSVRALGPRLVLAWSGAPETAKTAYITVFDGNAVTTLNILPGYASSGAVTCNRKSANIQAVLFVDDGKRTFGSHSSLLAADAGETSALGSGPKGERTSAWQISEIARLRARDRRLEALVTVLRHRSASKEQPRRR